MLTSTERRANGGYAIGGIVDSWNVL